MFVVAIVPPWHEYFDQADDVVSVLTIPIVPNIIYAALLAVMGGGPSPSAAGGVVGAAGLVADPAAGWAGSST